MKDSAYKKAGVDIEAGADVVKRIRPHVMKTHRAGVMDSIGGFGAFFDLKETGYKDPLLVSATDGVGTKIKIAIDYNIHHTVGIDAVAMCVNDLVVQGAEPLFFLDYFATGRLSPEVAETVIAGVSAGCVQAGCALIGGETAEMPGLYADGDYDLAGFTVGAVERNGMVTGAAVSEGDVLLGLASNGLHSNGFSLVRKLVEEAQDCDYDKPAPFDEHRVLAEALLEPTRIYVRPVLAALPVEGRDGRRSIHGMAHITGGGLVENVPRMIPDGLCADIDASNWTLPPVFAWLRDAGDLSFDDLSLTFNCGIGFVLACDPDTADQVTKSLGDSGELVFELGRVVKSAGDQKIIIRNGPQAWQTKV